MKSVLIAMVLSSALAASAANTWHVDDDWLDRDGDGSAEKPYGMIQQAVNAASSCDTILVAPGTYDRTPTEANGCIVVNYADLEPETFRTALLRFAQLLRIETVGW